MLAFYIGKRVLAGYIRLRLLLLLLLLLLYVRQLVAGMKSLLTGNKLFTGLVLVHRDQLNTNQSISFSRNCAKQLKLNPFTADPVKTLHFAILV